MKHKIRTKAMSWLLSLAMALGLAPGMSLTAHAASYSIWVGGTQVTDDNANNIDGSGKASYDAGTNTLTLNGYQYSGKGYEDSSHGFHAIYTEQDLIINLSGDSSVEQTPTTGGHGIGVAYGKNLTIEGTGTLTVKSDGDAISVGKNLTIEGGTVTANASSYWGIKANQNMYIRGGTVSATGGDGGIKSSSMSISGGTVTATGTATDRYGIFSENNPLQITSGDVTASGSKKAIAYKVKNAIPGTGWDSLEGTGNGTSIEISETEQTLNYKKVRFKQPHDHNFTYAASGATITATCSADGCTLPASSEGAGDHVATLTIAAPSEGGNTAELTGDKSEFDLTGVTITYQKKVSTGWQDTEAPGNDDSGIFKASVTLKGTDNVEATAFVTYGVSAVTKGNATNPEGKSYDFTVPKVAAVGAKITPTPTTAFDTGYGIKKIIVKDESENDVSTVVQADTEGFIMPEYNVTVDVEFGMIDYTITKNGTTNGTFTVKKGENEVTTANYGDTVTLTATPDSGFALKSFTVKDSTNHMLETSGAGNTRTFTMPAANVTVSATFEGAPFDVTISNAITGGTVAVSSALENGRAKAGSEVTLTVTPDAGYQLETLKYNNTAITASNGVYKFTMPTEAVTVTATFVGKPVTASLNVTGNAGTDCTAAMLDSSYKEVNSVTQKAGEKFILLVNRDDEYDFNVKCGTSDVSMTEFTEDEYKDYIAYANKNNISVSTNTVLAWVTMPGAEDGSVTLTVNFSKLQTFTVLYQPSDSSTTAVWCKFAVNSGVDDNNTDSAQMKSDATMGDGSKVYSLKVTARFAPNQVDFATSSDGFGSNTMKTITAKEAAPTQESDWTPVTGGKAVIIGGDAKTVIVAFVADADAMKAYKDNAVDAAKTTGGVEYRVAVVAGGNAGTVKAPANTFTKVDYDFAGWRGFEGTAPNKTEKIYNAGESISVSENTTLNAVWNLKKSTVTLNLNGGTGNRSVGPVTYGEKLPTLENPTRNGFAFDGWTASNTVTEDDTLFAKGSPFDLSTNITADLGLTAQWKHVHTYTCYQISAFGDRLAKYQKYENALHIAVCGCNDIQLMAHEFDGSGKCACGYQKPGAQDVTLNISYGQWSNGTYSEKMQGMPETAKQGQEVSIYAPNTWGSLQFSKWQYSAGDGQWADLTADAYASFLIPATMTVRALYVNPVTEPQVELSARKYDDQTVVNGQTYTMDNILFQMNYKLPDGYTFVDAGIRLGDNAGISYYELKERTITTDAGGKAMLIGAAAVMNFLGDVTTVDLSATDTYYEEHTRSVLTELSAATLAKYMYESKPINVEKYDPIYWEAKAVTKGMSGSMATLPPLRFAQKDNQNHWIYGIGWLRYKDSSGNIKTIYTDALAATVKSIPGNTVTNSGS